MDVRVNMSVERSNIGLRPNMLLSGTQKILDSPYMSTLTYET